LAASERGRGHWHRFLYFSGRRGDIGIDFSTFWAAWQRGRGHWHRFLYFSGRLVAQKSREIYAAEACLWISCMCVCMHSGRLVWRPQPVHTSIRAYKHGSCFVPQHRLIPHSITAICLGLRAYYFYSACMGACVRASYHCEHAMRACHDIAMEYLFHETVCVTVLRHWGFPGHYVR